MSDPIDSDPIDAAAWFASQSFGGGTREKLAKDDAICGHEFVTYHQERGYYVCEKCRAIWGPLAHAEHLKGVVSSLRCDASLARSAREKQAAEVARLTALLAEHQKTNAAYLLLWTRISEVLADKSYASRINHVEALTELMSADLDCQLYRDMLEQHEKATAIAALLAERDRELKNIREEIVEHVMDGLDYDFVAAIVYIRAWREELARIKARDEQTTRLFVKATFDLAERDRQLADADRHLNAFKTSTSEASLVMHSLRELTMQIHEPINFPIAEPINFPIAESMVSLIDGWLKRPLTALPAARVLAPEIKDQA